MGMAVDEGGNPPIPLHEAKRRRAEEEARSRNGSYGPNGKDEPPITSLPFVAFRDIKPNLDESAVIKGWIGEGTMSVLYGDSNTGKTFLALDMALHIALGWPWRGRPVKQGAAIYIAGEGAYGIKNRVAAFRKHYCIPDDQDVPFALIICPVDLRSPEAVIGQLIATINEVAARFDCTVVEVTVDTLSRALAGGNENDSADMGAYVMNIDRVRQASGSHVLSVHHSGKDQARGARGHSLLRAATDTEIEVTRDDVTGISTAKAVKQRDLPIHSEGISFVLKVVTIGIVTGGEEITSCVTAVTDDIVTPRRPDLTGAYKLAYDQLLNCISDIGVSPPDNDNYPLGSRVIRVTDWLKYLKSSGVIDDAGPNPRVYWKRIKERLLSSGYIRIWGEWVWTIGP